MLEFPQDYFKTEECSGYMVGETFKRTWAAQLEILQRLIGIFDKYNLEYYIFWGSLLGTIRHRGFIPWDDDLDIAMLGEDYIIFLEIAKQELPAEYQILNPYTSDEFGAHFTRIVNNREIDLTGEMCKKYHGCPIVMGIDVFPLYYIPRDKTMADEQKMILTLIRNVRDIIEYRNNNPEQDEKEKRENDLAVAQSLIDIKNMTGYQFASKRPIPRQLDMLFDQISRIATREESDCVASFDEYIVNNRRIYPISYFDDPIKLPFENIMVTAPREYDIILKDVYRDYMVPRNYNKLDAHAAVKEQLRLVGEWLERVYLQEKHGGRSFSIKKNELQKTTTVEERQSLLPEEWAEKVYICDKDGNMMLKRVIMYYISLENLMLHSGEAVEKISSVLETFRRQKDTVLWWFVSVQEENIPQILSMFIPETMEKYRMLVKQYKEENWGIYDDSGDVVRAITVSDAYYGDKGIFSSMCLLTEKHIMYQDYKVRNEL